jgi:hypothetical protein
VPLSNFVPRGFGFVHHSIATLYHEVPNPNLSIRNFFIRSKAAADSLLGSCDSLVSGASLHGRSLSPGQPKPSAARLYPPPPPDKPAPHHHPHDAVAGGSQRGSTQRTATKKLRIVRLGFGTFGDQEWLLNDGRIQNPSYKVR